MLWRVGASGRHRVRCACVVRRRDGVGRGDWRGVYRVWIPWDSDRLSDAVAQEFVIAYEDWINGHLGNRPWHMAKIGITKYAVEIHGQPRVIIDSNELYAANQKITNATGLENLNMHLDETLAQCVLLHLAMVKIGLMESRDALPALTTRDLIDGS